MTDRRAADGTAPSGRRPSEARSFGTVATRYDRVRPSYPPAIVDWIVADVTGRAVDLGAGTGKLTALLARRGLAVVGIEPSMPMARSIALGATPAPAVSAVAEELPVRSATVDLVTAAQAWHWMDPHRTGSEVHRVLRPSGRVAVVWNVRDVEVPWIRELDTMLDARTGPPACAMPAVVDLGPGFTAAAHRRVTWERRIGRHELVELCATRSPVIALPPRRRRALLDDVRHLLDTHPDTRGRRWITLSYVTHAWRSSPRAPAAPVAGRVARGHHGEPRP